ncbi:MAG: hypothetical protein FWG10_12495 [Eubacteriaceae bacterium]|nr:hypothetical protein [Eubacteriaceae bacterium]
MADTKDAQALQEERYQLYEDFFNYRVPKRLPVSVSVGQHILAERGGIDFFEFQFDYSKLLEEGAKICEILYSDTCPVGGIGDSTRTPVSFQLLNSQSFQMGSGGFVQHPEVIGMLASEYDELIEDAYKTIVEKVIARQHKALSMDNPVVRGNAIHQAIVAKQEDGAALGPSLRALVEKYGYYTGAPAGSSGFGTAPYDFLADQLRSFSEVSLDIRRDREKVKAACEALYPVMFLYGLPSKPHLHGQVGFPLHMPTYMREKDFVEVWMPTYIRMVEQYVARGIRTSAFHEHDWMRYVDILQDFPVGTIMRFEYADYQLVKDKLAKTHIIGGMYPITNVKTKSKQENIDEVKRLIDICAPGGGYQFGFDKSAIRASDIPMESFIAVAETVRDYGVYDNPGGTFAMPINSENFKLEETPKIKGKYAFDWDEFQKTYPYTPDSARERFERYDNMMFKYYISLLV